VLGITLPRRKRSVLLLLIVAETGPEGIVVWSSWKIGIRILVRSIVLSV
jgi:hypothetical protein